MQRAALTVDVSPGGHKLHCVLPDTFATRPLGHSTQRPCVVSLLYFPALHTLHSVAACSAGVRQRIPAPKQRARLTLFASEPALQYTHADMLAARYLPLGHLWHSRCSLVVVLPAPHGVQPVCVELASELVGQCEQLTAPYPLANVCTGHKEHARPSGGWYDTGSRRRHSTCAQTP